MKILISASNALSKWLGLDLPRISGVDGKGVGVQPVTTTTDTLAWQCHIVENHHRSRHKTIIAVESYSRYTLLIPCTHRFTQDELELLILNRWLRDLLGWAEETHAVPKPVLGQLCEKVDATDFSFQWIKNTDLSINGHVADANHWLRDILEQEGATQLSDELAYLLGRHINQQFKRAKAKAGGKQRFYPVERLIEHGFKCFVGERSNLQIEVPSPAHQKLPDNVVSMAEFREKSSG